MEEETFRGGTRSRAPVPPAPDFLFPVLIVIESRRQLDSYRSQFRWPENGRLYLATKTGGGGARRTRRRKFVPFTDGTVSARLLERRALLPPPLNSSTTNPCRFSLPRQLLRAFTPITLDGFPPVLAFRLRKEVWNNIQGTWKRLIHFPFFLSNVSVQRVK